MNKFTHVVPAAIVLGTMAITAPVGAAPPLGLQGDVTVQNDETNPVPVAVQGDVPVTIEGTVPVTVEGTVTTADRVPIAASGVWTFAGLSLPSMILHDLTIYYDQEVGEPATCTFFMNFVIDQFNSRPFNRVTLDTFESVEFHYEAGIDTSNLRFGTGFGTTCTRNWTAMGFALE